VIDKIKQKLEGARLVDLFAILALFLSSLLFFSDLFDDQYLLTERDLAPYFIPPRFFWVESLKRGDFPLWNPYQFSGHPFFANPQNATLYPLNGLFFFLPFDIAFNATILLHFFLAGLFTYLLLRDLKAKPAGSLISGLIWMLGGYLLSVHSLLTILLSVVWTPLVILFFRRAMERPGVRNEILTAIFITLSFLGGGIEIVYGNFFVLLVMVIFPVQRINFEEPLLNIGINVIPAKAGIQKSTGFPRIKYPVSSTGQAKAGLIKSGMTSCLEFIPLCMIRFRTLFIISILFIFLSAVQLVPFLELWTHSIRGLGITYQEATVWSLAPKDFLLFFLPDVYGYFVDMKKYWVTQCWLKTMYTGGLPFLLSFLFFLRVRKDRIFFMALMFFSLFLSLGQYNPLYPLVFKYLPFFNGIRYPVKFLYLFILALSITAGLGFERLIQFSKEKEDKRLKHLLIFCSLFSGIVLLFLILGHQEIERVLKLKEIDFPHFNHLHANLYHLKRFFFYLTLFFLLFRVGYEVKWKGWIKILLLFFLAADLFGNMGFYGREKSQDYFRKTGVLEIITSDQEALRAFSTGKTVALDNPILIGNGSPFDLIKEKHLPSLNMIFQVRDIWGLDVVRLKRSNDLYKQLISLPSISSSRLIDLYGIKYVISITPMDAEAGFKLVYARLESLEGNKEDLLKQNTIKLYRNKNHLQRAWLVKDFRVMDPKEILSTMATMDFRPDELALLEETPSYSSRREGKGGGRVEVVSESNNRLSLQVRADDESILVLSDTYYPGWKAFVNGKKEKILCADYDFRGVVLPKGSNQVEFVYSPVSFKLGLGLTLFGMTVCGMMVWIGRKKTSRV
jgi:hypothetical protein